MDKNWLQLTPSQFPWEQDALVYIKEQLPDHEPYRAWANFEFIAQDGSINEIDLMVLTPKGLYLVEIKSHPGEISGDAGIWIWHKPDGGQKLFDNPRILTDRKAKKLASLLKVQPSARTERIPFLNSVVFLSAENVINNLEGPSKSNVFTRKDFIKEVTEINATSLSSKSRTATEYSQLGDVDTTTFEEVRRLVQEIATAIETSRFLALTVKPQRMNTAREKLCKDYPLKHISFDELLLRHLQQLFNGMPKPPRWDVVLKADAAQKNSVDWGRLQMLVSKVLPVMADEIKSAGQPVLLTEPGLIARYDLVHSWLNELRQYLLNADSVSCEVHGLILLVAADAQRTAAVIDGTTIPRGTGAAEFARIASVWLNSDDNTLNTDGQEVFANG